MKKLSIGLLVILMCGILCVFAGCDTNPTENKDINIEDCEVGYKVDVYPNFPFDYSAELDGESYIVHIESIEVTLTEKNAIKEGEVVTEQFYPYAFTVVAKANTTSTLVGRTINIRILRNDLLCMIQTKVKESGEIEWVQIWNLFSIPKLSFSDIILF